MLFAPGAGGDPGSASQTPVPAPVSPVPAPVSHPPQEVTILLTERAHTMRSHPGQVSFPGGRAEPTDRDLVDTALRETNEEVGVEPASVEVAGVLPPLNLVVSSHDVSPVLGWWPAPGRVWVREPREVARVLQVPVTDLIDPANRFRVGHPGGWVGPAFQADDLVVWGFTALLLDGILRLAGWEVPWDESDVRPVP
nr:CoA pyrophosphatase [Ornithinimicrobium sp. F0845]